MSSIVYNYNINKLHKEIIMAKISYDAAQSNLTDDRSFNGKVTFFYLRNPGSEAIVRFMIDTIDDLDLLTVHPVEIDGKFRNVNCLREVYDPIDVCPLCASDAKIASKAYIKLIKYERDDSGKVVATPQVWERNVSYAKTIKNLLDEYGPLSEHLFKIKREGSGLDTTYSILYAPPTIYKSEMYPFDENTFADFEVSKMVINKSAEELTAFLQTGEFPKATKPNEQKVKTPEPTFSAPQRAAVAQAVPVQPMMSSPAYAQSGMPTYDYTQPASNNFNRFESRPWEPNYQTSAGNQAVERPVRQF